MQERPEIHQAIAALQRLCELFAVRRQQLAADAGITESQWRLLEEIADEAFMPSMFARRRDCTPAAISRGLRALLERRWVTAEIAQGDARQRRYQLTAEGRRMLERLRRGRERAIHAVWQGFDPAALRGFVAFAGDLADHLDAYAKERSRSTEARRARL